jgi:hypothetical protein
MFSTQYIKKKSSLITEVGSGHARKYAFVLYVDMIGQMAELLCFYESSLLSCTYKLLVCSKKKLFKYLLDEFWDAHSSNSKEQGSTLNSEKLLA